MRISNFCAKDPRDQYVDDEFFDEEREETWEEEDTRHDNMQRWSDMQ